MTLFNCLSKKNKIKMSREGVYKVDVKEFDDSFKIPLILLKGSGIRLFRKDSNTARYLWNVYFWFAYCNIFVATVLEVISMVQTGSGGSFQDAVVLFRMMPCVGYLLLAMAKSYKLVVHRPMLENLYNELREMWPKGDVTKEESDVIKNAVNRLQYVVKVYYWSNNFLTAVFMGTPFVEVFARAVGYETAKELPFFYWFPFDPYRPGLYEFILVVQTWHGMTTVWFLVSADLLLCIFLSHITTLLDLLSLRISRMVRVPVDHQLIEGYPLATHSKEPEKQFLEVLKVCGLKNHYEKELYTAVTRHRTLIRFADDIESLFSFSLLLNFFNSSIVICFCGFCSVIVEKWNEVNYKSFLVTALCQTWLFCWYGQKLLDSSQGVADALYDSGWYRIRNKKVTSTIMIMILRAQKEIRVTAYGFSVISLATYSTIIRSAWSYFTLLMNIYRK